MTVSNRLHNSDKCVDYLTQLRYSAAMSNPKKPRLACLACGKETARAMYKYCSNQCQIDYQYTSYIHYWKMGYISGLQLGTGTVSGHIKRYLRQKYHNQCCLCGWKEVNPFTNVVPLVADHIDGNWENNTENNLRLICPNCDSLTATYAGLNRGKGRKSRVESKRVKRAKSLRNTPP